jgi:hypothetical protein
MDTHPAGVCMIQGQRPKSAIHDHCRVLCAHLQSLGIAAGVAPPESVSRLRSSPAAVFHLHYPGWPLSLQLLALPHRLGLRLRREALVVTIHDLTKFAWPLRLGFVPLLLCARRLIFSTAAELQAAKHLMRWLGCDIARKSHLIPIGSSIPKSSTAQGARAGVAYFGHIRSGKGIETVLDAAHIMHSGGRSDPFFIIGNIETCDALRFRYAASLAARVWNLTEAQRRGLHACTNSQEFAHLLQALPGSHKRLPNVTWLIDADEHACADTLARCRFALMPFADGASLRRSSLQAALINGCITLTTWGPQTDDMIKAVTLRIASAADAVDIITHRDDFSALEHAMTIHEARIDWRTIAHEHAKAYALARAKAGAP